MKEEAESVTIEQGLDFILSHFQQQEPLWPRNVATAATNTKQYPVEDKDRALLYYNAARKEDCRIAIYPNYERMQETGAITSEYKPIPSHLFAEHDLKDFNNKEELDAALKAMLRRIKKELNGAIPTVLWSGGGYHIHQPLDITEPFENLEEFKKHENVSVKFLRYSARRLSNNKSDPNHNLSFKSCLCRVPGSINSKYQGDIAEVKIVQRWNGVRAKPTKQFITDFLISLVQKDVDKVSNTAKQKLPSRIRNGTTTSWIERLLVTPISDYRRNARDLILIPYLIVSRGLEPNQVYNIVMQWADKCSELKPLQPSRHAYADRVSSRIKEVVRDKVPPMTWSKLKEMNPTLFETLSTLSKGINTSQYNYDHMSNDSEKDTDLENEHEQQNSGQANVAEGVSAGAKFLSSRMAFEDGVPKTVHMITKDMRQCPVTIEKINGHDVETMWAKAEEATEPGVEKDLKMTSHVLARKIQSYLARGIQDIEITKHGKTGFGVTYDVRTLNESEDGGPGKIKQTRL
jgi:hypothetical protein